MGPPSGANPRRNHLTARVVTPNAAQVQSPDPWGKPKGEPWPNGLSGNLRIHEPGEANRQQSVDAVQNWHMLCQCRVIGRRVSKDGPCSSCSILSLLPYLIIFFALHLVFFLPLSCLFLCFFIFCFPSSYSHIFEMTFHFVSTTQALPRY